MAATFSEKLLARNAGRAQVRPGEVHDITPDVILSHDNSAAIIRIFRQLPQKRVLNPERLAITLDHAVPPPTPRHAQNHAEIRAFVAEQGIPHFFEMGRGICHQVHCEEGVVGPGMILLGADSHSPHCGWLGAFGAGVGRTEIAALWATGQLWLRVPQTLRITLTGRLAPGVMSKDLALQLIGQLGADGANYMAVEFDGPGVATLSADMRAALTNMMAEMGAKNAFIAPDALTWEWLEMQLQRSRPADWRERMAHFRQQALLPDADADCAQRLDMALDEVEPAGLLPAPRRQHAAGLGAGRNARGHGLHRHLHKRTPRRPGGGGANRARSQAARPTAGHPGLGPGAGRRAGCRLAGRPDRCRREHWHARLRPLHGRARGRAGARRSLHQQREPQFPRPHGRA